MSEKVIDPKEITLLRQSLMVLRDRVLSEIDGFDQELARLEPEDSGSFQIPTDWDEFYKKYL